MFGYLLTGIGADMRVPGLLTRVVPFDKMSRLLAEVDRAAEGRKQPDDPSTAVTTEVLALGLNLAPRR